MPHLLQFDPRHKVLLVAFSGRVTEAVYMAAYEDVAEFIRAHGFYSGIVDFSAVDEFDLSHNFARRIGVMMRPVIPGARRVVVAPQPVIYGTARIVAALREGTEAEVTVTKSLTEAYAVFGKDDFTFEEWR